jgi:hypothetical protein
VEVGIYTSHAKAVESCGCKYLPTRLENKNTFDEDPIQFKPRFRGFQDSLGRTWKCGMPQTRMKGVKDGFPEYLSPHGVSI